MPLNTTEERSGDSERKGIVPEPRRRLKGCFVNSSTLHHRVWPRI